MHKIGEFRIGWELEYQSSSFSGDGDRELDEDAYTEWQLDCARDARDENLAEVASPTFITRLINSLSEDQCAKVISEFEEGEGEGESIRDLIEGISVNRLVTLDILDYYDWEEHYLNHFVSYFDIPDDCYRDTEIDLPSTLVRCNDASVSGGEIKPHRPLSIEKAVEMLFKLDEMYNFRDDLDVDGECSFHVHVSVVGKKHSYGKNFQALMLEYLSDNLAELPSSVLKRFSSDTSQWRDRYFKIDISDNKYSAVAFRPEHGTWEFRIFGGIQSPEEGACCIQMAIAAYSWAYKNKCSTAKNIGILQTELVARADAIIRKRCKLAA